MSYSIRTIDYILIGLFLLVTCLLILMTWKTTEEGTECLLNPGEYFVGGLEKSSNSIVTCQCTMNKPNSAILVVTSNGSFNLDPRAESFRQGQIQGYKNITEQMKDFQNLSS